MNYILIAVEVSPDKTAAGRLAEVDKVLPVLGKSCHVLNAMWILSTPKTAAEVFRQLTDQRAAYEAKISLPLLPTDKLIVAPIQPPAEDDEPWQAHNAPTAVKCFSMP
jgi:hypothetical protein